MKTEPSMNTVDFFTFCELHQLWQAVILQPLKNVFHIFENLQSSLMWSQLVKAIAAFWKPKNPS